MKLYELPRGSYFKIVGDDQLYYFVKIDGAYSYCLECQDDGSIYGVDFLKKKERVQTKWIYLKKGQKVFFKVFDMTDKDANKRKLEAGIRDFSNNIKYVNRSEEIDYKFSIEKSGKYQCFVSNYNDQNIELLGEIEILER